jgi:isopenicillin N synthase-like dioxygenase
MTSAALSLEERPQSVIDLGADRNPTEADWARVAAELGAACRDVGFFYVVNHGVPASLVAAAFAASRAFFALPVAEKLELSMDVVGGNRGYAGFMREALDPTHGRDRKEAFNVGLELAADDPGRLAGEPYRALNAWPRTAGFRDTMLAYFDACLGLGDRIHRAFARDLGLDPEYFVEKLQRPLATLRLLRYPPEPVGEIGAGTHTDYGNITLLATDGVGGLEIRDRAGRWLAAPSIPGAFVVNIGDCLMRWTNDVYVSTPHRVVSRGAGERFSIAFFLDPNPYASVEAIPSCVAAGDKPKYPPILAHEYLRSRLEPTYLPG